MTIILGTQGFHGEIPKLSPHKLPPGYASIARNVKAYSGNLESFREPRTVDTSEKAGTASSFYLMGADPDVDAEGTISSVTNTTPITVVTASAHGLVTGQHVHIDGTGIVAIDGKKFGISVLNSTSFSLNSTTASGTATTGEWTRRNGYWLAWTGGVDIDAVKAPYKNDTSIRTAYTGQSTPRVTNVSLVTTGGFEYPEAWYILGVPAPLNEPTVVVQGAAPSDASQYDYRSYIYTYVTAWNEESAPSPASVVAAVGPDQSAVVSGFDAAPTGAYNIVGRRVYRWVAEAGQYRLCNEHLIGITQITDGAATSALPQTSLVSADWDTPPADLTGLVVMANGFMAGYYGNDVYFSEPYQPHAWPLNYRRTVNQKVTGLAAYKSTLIVGTQGHPVIIVGTHPGGMVDEEITNHQSCESKRSMVSVGDMGAVYASPDGLILIGTGGWDKITRQYFDYDEWQLFNPRSMKSAIHNGKYFCFYRSGAATVTIRGRTYPGNGGFWIDPLEPNGVFFIDDDPDAVHVDLVTDSLYLLKDNAIKRWDGGTTLRAYQYRSKTFLLQRPLNYASCRVDAESYTNTTVKLFTSNRMKSKEVVNGESAFRMGGRNLDRRMQVEVSGTNSVSTVAIGESLSSLAEGAG